jgi:uncharacterized protein (TIGR03083 family)
VEHWETIADQRRALADQLESLTPEQWATPSLCDAWAVRDVVAHLVMPHVTSMPRFLVAFVAARGNFERANVALTAEVAGRSDAELLEAFRRCTESRVKPPGFGSEAPLTDILVHGQDIRVPLGLPTDPAVDPWRTSLEFLVLPKARRGFAPRSLRGLRLTATDCEWSHGSGDEVAGPAIALALTVLGRTARVGDLTGAGAQRLAALAAG